MLGRRTAICKGRVLTLMVMMLAVVTSSTACGPLARLTPAPTATSTPKPSPTNSPTATLVLPTATSSAVPPTHTQSPTATWTSTATPTPSNTATWTPTATATPVPPTATDTAIPPTSTATPTPEPSPILPKPPPGLGVAVGRYFCGGEPGDGYEVTLVAVGTRNQKFPKTKTDAQGWWHLSLSPGEYVPAYGRLYAGSFFYRKSNVRTVEPGRVADFGVKRSKDCPKYKGW